ncbi:DUF5666 domain-containing protein [Rubrivirga sp. IMCC43871]|uniref:DUF5666 domain-containing protein n=1 Tax=Rubrivirga sp. IMCC43871 TaxID=3391575 RepID=UPI0039903386
MRSLRLIPLLALALVAGCDAVESGPSVEYQVRATRGASTAEVATDGQAARTVGLPFAATSSASTFDITAAAASGLEVTVVVDGAVRERGAGRVVALRGDADGEEVEVRGPIEALDEATVTVRGLAFALTAETEVDDDLSLDALAVGDVVEIEGRYDGSGLVAEEIEVEDGRDDGYEDDEVEVEGRIEALADGEIVVAGLAFVVVSETEIEGTTFAALTVGDRVEVEGLFDADDVLIATEIEIDDEDDGDDESDD